MTEILYYLNIPMIVKFNIPEVPLGELLVSFFLFLWIAGPLFQYYISVEVYLADKLPLAKVILQTKTL